MQRTIQQGLRVARPNSAFLRLGHGNIAEGFGRNGKVEFSRYLGIAQASVVEVQSHLYIALDLGYLTQPEFDDLYS